VDMKKRGITSRIESTLGVEFNPMFKKSGAGIVCSLMGTA